MNAMYLVIESIWLVMNTLYGHRWHSSQGMKPSALALALWADALEGLDETQIKTGIKACSKLGDDWPPSLPQFRKLCLGIPPFVRVKQEIRQSDYSAFTRFVMGFLDYWQYRNADQYQAEKLLRQAYECAVIQRMEGAPLPEPPAALLKKPEPAKPITEEERQAKIKVNQLAAEKAIKEIKELFGGQ